MTLQGFEDLSLDPFSELLLTCQGTVIPLTALWFLVPCQKSDDWPRCSLKSLGLLGAAEPKEKEMATHSSVLAWRIPGTGEPGGLPSMGSRRVGHD